MHAVASAPKAAPTPGASTEGIAKTGVVGVLENGKGPTVCLMKSLCLGGLAALAVGLAGCGRPAEPADAIYINANVITMNDAQPRAEALAVKDGKVLAVGSRTEAEAHKGPSTRVVDVEGKTITPGFIDGHGHLSGVGLSAAGANLLPPPDGRVRSIPELQQTMRDYIQSSSVPKTYGIAFGTGYDDSQAASPDAR